jgi:DMSO/TMAO reductase YedYZ molybdopterin-dependent catalytic subunit
MRSIPREVALGDAFLAYEMNGRPIPLLHGGPLRLIVPGWFGMASTKWLTHLHARPEPSDNHFMVRGYRYGDGSPVERMKVKSEIALPAEGAVVPAGQLRVVGAAWTGAGGIRAVEVSADGGSSWQAAQLTGPDHPGAWRTWEHTLPLTRPGDYTIRARATDRTGTVQPAAAEPNPGGYGNNSIHEVRIHVAA